MRVRFNPKAVFLLLGLVGWGLVLRRYGEAVVAYLFLLLFGLFGFAVNTSGRPGDDPTYPLGQFPLISVVLILVLPPIGLIFIAVAKRPGWLTVRRDFQRWRVRTLMAGIALVACVLGLIVGLQRRAERFRRLAAYHREADRYFLDKVGPLPTEATTADCIQIAASRGKSVSHAFDASLYHGMLANKYAFAAQYPWCPAEVDPPPPPESDPPFTPETVSFDSRKR